MTPLGPAPKALPSQTLERTARARVAARLDQVVCSLEGMATLLQDTPGDFAVVIHGDRDCLGVLVQGMDYPGTERFFGTQLGEPEAVAGRGGARLRACLEAVCGEARPQVVFVLGTCMSALLGEDVEALSSQLGQETGVRVVALGGAGMGFVSQAEILDRHACLLLEATAGPRSVEGPAVEPGGLALLGFDPGSEVRDLLVRLDVPTTAVLDRGAPLSAWQRLPAAQAHLLLDRSLYPRLASMLRDRYGQETREVPFPVGLQATRGFFGALLGARMEAAGAGALLASMEDEARDAVASARPRCAGLRLGFNLGSKKNLEARTLARAGLTDLPAFEELGFEPVLLVQGDDSPGRLEALRETLTGLGCHAPLRIFADTVLFGELCRAEGCRLVYASDHLRDEVEQAGAGFLPQGVLEPGWGGVRANLGRIFEALGEKP